MITHRCRGTKYVPSAIAINMIRYKWTYKDSKVTKDEPIVYKPIIDYENYLITPDGKIFKTIQSIIELV